MSPYNFIERSERATIKSAYRLKHGMEKLARLKNHLTFLIRCRNNEIIPYGLRVSLPLKSRGSKRIAERTGQALLRQLIRDTRWKRERMTNEVLRYETQLQETLTVEQQQPLREWCSTAASKMDLKAKTRQRGKFERLLTEKQGARLTLDPKKVVKNFSSRTLTSDEEGILALAYQLLKS